MFLVFTRLYIIFFLIYKISDFISFDNKKQKVVRHVINFIQFLKFWLFLTLETTPNHYAYFDFFIYLQQQYYPKYSPLYSSITQLLNLLLSSHFSILSGKLRFLYQDVNRFLLVCENYFQVKAPGIRILLCQKK